jgi:drug/metabolite transporter (DMT)-like permease
MTTAGLALLAALANAAQIVISKDLTRGLPARQLIGVLYLGNALVVLPFAPLVAWHWNTSIAALHLVSVGLMVVTAVAIWDMLDAGAASSTATASALSPIPAMVATGLLIPGSFVASQAIAATIVTAGVLLALLDAFEPLGRRGTILRVLTAAGGNGLLTVVTRLIGDAGAGVVDTYLVRTFLAAMVCLALFPPREIPLRAAPRLYGRSLVVTAYFLLLIVAAQGGSPVVVQTVVATTPLLVLVWESVRARRRPAARIVLAAGLVVSGVAVMLAW